MCLRPAGFRVVFMAMIGTTSTPLRSPWSSKGPARRPEARFFFRFCPRARSPELRAELGCATSKRCRTGGAQAPTVTRYPALSLSPASPGVNEGAGQHSNLRPWAARMAPAGAHLPRKVADFGPFRSSEARALAGSSTASSREPRPGGEYCYPANAAIAVPRDSFVARASSALRFRCERLERIQQCIRRLEALGGILGHATLDNPLELDRDGPGRRRR
jgi:hypothetical protein